MKINIKLFFMIFKKFFLIDKASFFNFARQSFENVRKCKPFNQIIKSLTE